MTRPSYDLLTEPWIPVLRMDGTADALGLRDVLHQAHELRGLTGETPLVTASLYRLLLAVLYRALGMPTSDTWEDLWEEGRFPAEALDAYFSRWQDRFDLFHPERPFLQWPDERVKPKSVINLVPHMASGNNATLFDHHHEGEDVTLSPDVAARALLVGMTFGLAGLSGLPQKFTDGPWTRGIIFLAEGDSLFETLMFNYLPAHHLGFEMDDTSLDRPFWEAEHPLSPNRKVPLGMTDYLTWPNRAVRLFPEPDGQGGWVVRRVSLAPALALAPTVSDPYKHYRVDKKRGRLVLRFQEGRALWRDSAVLLQLQSEDQWPPRPFAWLADLADMGTLPTETRFRFMALGMANNQAKIDFYREEHFPVPREYLLEPVLVQQLAEALSLAESTGRALGRALNRLATLILSPTADDPEGRKPDRKDVDNLTGHWGGRRFYWAELEAPFWHMLLALPQEGERALDVWRETVHRTALHAFHRVAGSLGETPRVLKAVARAERQLLGALFCVFHPQDKRCQAKRNTSKRR